MINENENSGFTLVEVVLYLVISSTILMISSFFAFSLFGSRVASQTASEVEQQGIRVTREITQAVRNAEGVVSPNPGNETSFLILGDTTIEFDLSGGSIRVSEGGGPAISLTNSRVIASDLKFQNLSRAGTPGTIRVSFVLTHVNPDGRKEYDFAKTFHNSASLRQP